MTDALPSCTEAARPALRVRQVVIVVAVLLGALGATLSASSAIGANLPVSLGFRGGDGADAARHATLGGFLTETEQALVQRQAPLRVAVPVQAAPPYLRLSASGEVTGIHPDMLVSLGKALGLRFVPIPVEGTPGALRAAREGSVDLLMTVDPSIERLVYLAFTLGATPKPGALFARVGQPARSPETARFALSRESSAVAHVARQFPRAKLDLVDTPLDALRRVAEGRADFFLGGLLETTELIAEQKLTDVVPVQQMHFGSGFHHFAVRKELQELIPVLNKGIQSLRAQPSEELAAALARVPPQLRGATPLKLSDDESTLVQLMPVWRVGAVRGLRSLNDVSENGLHTGISSEYVEQVARRVGVTVEVQAYDSVSQMLDALRGGQIDLVPFLSRTASRERVFEFSQAYLQLPYLLITRSDGPLIWGLSTMSGRRLALGAQHPLREIVAREYPSIQVLDAANGSEAMDMVALGDADAAVEIKLFANLRINSDPSQRLRLSSVVSEVPSDFHFAARRDAAPLLGMINRALAEIPPEERQRMLSRWVAVDLEPPFPWRRYLPLASVSALALLVMALGTAWWMRRLHGEVRARRRSEGLLRDIARTIPAIGFRYVLNAPGRPGEVYVSPSAKSFLGFMPTQGDSLVRALKPYLDPAHWEVARDAEVHSLATGDPLKLTVRYQYPGRAVQWLHCESVQDRDDEGRVTWTGYVVDVTSERDLQARLARESEARNLLLATASHELRAPTHNLSLALQSLHERDLPEPAALSLRIAKRAAKTLTQLLNDVLDVARLEAGPIPLRLQTFDLREAIETLADAWRASARDKGLGFTLDVAADVPTTLTQDPLRLNQVLTNLLSNAYKYTAQGLIGLSVSRLGQDLVFAVRDTGPGLNEFQQQRLFQPFVTLQEGTMGSSPIGSTGLGLVVARQIAERLGGRLEVTSKPGSGSVFTFSMPVSSDWQVDPNGAARAEPAEHLRSGSAQSGSRPSAAVEPQPRVVVCDDDPVSRLLSAQILRLRGYQVIEAADGASAVLHCRDPAVRALVTDLDMPGMSGFEVIRQVRADEASAVPLSERDPDRARIVVIVCSGSPVPAGSDVPLHDAYLLKPVQIDTLGQTLEQLGIPGRRPPNDAPASQARALS